MASNINKIPAANAEDNNNSSEEEEKQTTQQCGGHGECEDRFDEQDDEMTKMKDEFEKQNKVTGDRVPLDQNSLNGKRLKGKL